MMGATDSWGWHHPEDEAAVSRLVVAARAAGRRVRVRGAGHSVPAAIAGEGDLVMVLDRLRGLRLDAATGEVTVGAGVRLGADPFDHRAPDGVALCPWLHARGRALPNVGGVLHQTVAGFLATGSGGGSTVYDAAAAVTALRLVDGVGRVRVLRAGEPAFQAAMVSMGAMGVITAVTLRTEPAYDVEGTEVVLPDSGAVPDLFADGTEGLGAYLARTPYARVLWWPQAGVRRISVWSARRVAPGAANPTAPYLPMPAVWGSTIPVQAAAGAALWGITHWRRPLAAWSDAAAELAGAVAAPAERALYRAFVDGDPALPQRFGGAWCDVLPQDARMDERLMPTTFTEVFVPLARAGEALRRLRALFDAEPAAAGRFAIELYAAPASTSWLHPSYGHASLRVNVFWLMHSPEDPRDAFFPPIWAALAPLGARLHWGKLFPHAPGSAVAGRYPAMDDFLAQRLAFDPDGVFLTAWLAAALDPSGAGTPAAPLPGARVLRPRLRWPLAFGLTPSGLALLDDADFVYDLTRFVPGSGEAAIGRMFDGSLGRAVPGLMGFTWHTPAGELADAVVDEAFVFMTLRLRTVAYTPGRHLAMSVDRCSLPLGSQMIEVIDAVPEGDGCRLRWRIAVRYWPGMAPAAPALTPLFRRLFERTLDALVASFAP